MNFVNTLTKAIYWLIAVLVAVISVYVVVIGIIKDTRALGDPYYEYDVHILERAPLAAWLTWIIWGISVILWLLSFYVAYTQRKRS